MAEANLGSKTTKPEGGETNPLGLTALREVILGQGLPTLRLLAFGAGSLFVAGSCLVHYQTLGGFRGLHHTLPDV